MRNDKKIQFIVVGYIFLSLNIFSETLPLKSFWQGKTEKALKESKSILEKKESFTKAEVISCYDFLAEYNLEQGHFEANLQYLNLLFSLKHTNSFDSAFHFSRLANYYHCYVRHDSATFFCKKAIEVFKAVNPSKVDRNEVARYYGYLGNASRNTSLRSLTFLDSALLYSVDDFTKALNHRRSGVFLLDRILDRDAKSNKFKVNESNYKRSIREFRLAAKIALKLYKSQGTDFLLRTYDLWSLAEKMKGNVKKSTVLNQKSKLEFFKEGHLRNDFLKNACFNTNVPNNLEEYRAGRGSLSLLFESEKLCKEAIPYWEAFEKEELLYSRKNFDDRYDFSPYAKLISIYYELYKLTRNVKYVYLIQGLNNMTTDSDIRKTTRKFDDVVFSSGELKDIQQLCRRKNQALISFVGCETPQSLMAIVCLPDTTLLVPCRASSNLEDLDRNIRNFQIQHRKTNLANEKNYDAFLNCFKSLDSVLQNRNLKTICIIPNEIINEVNFDLLASQAVSRSLPSKSILLDKYKITYQINTRAVLREKEDATTYSSVDIIAPDYRDSQYPEIVFGRKLIDFIQTIFTGDHVNEKAKQAFFSENKLIQFIGHVKSHAQSSQQALILSDTSQLTSSDFYKYNLMGSSYLLNGCASNVGKSDKNGHSYNLQNCLINQNAAAVITTLWPIDDADNANFLIKFYGFLQQGLSSSDALREAKLHFYRLDYPPAMWGGYIYYGSDFYLVKKPANFFVLYVALFILLSTFVVLFLRRRIKSNGKL